MSLHKAKKDILAYEQRNNTRDVLGRQVFNELVAGAGSPQRTRRRQSARGRAEPTQQAINQQGRQRQDVTQAQGRQQRYAARAAAQARREDEGLQRVENRTENFAQALRDYPGTTVRGRTQALVATGKKDNRYRQMALTRNNVVKAIVDNYNSGRKTGGDSCPGGHVTTHVVSYCRHPTNNGARFEVSNPRIIRNDAEWLRFLQKIRFKNQTYYINMSGDDEASRKQRINLPIPPTRRASQTRSNIRAILRHGEDPGASLTGGRGSRRLPGNGEARTTTDRNGLRFPRMIVNGLDNRFVAGRWTDREREAGVQRGHVKTYDEIARDIPTREGLCFFKNRDDRNVKCEGIEVFTTRAKKGGFQSWNRTNTAQGYRPSSGRNSIGRTQYDRLN
jgi:hypothetical protein